MYKGVRYRVSCQDLRAMVWTKEGSFKLANEWWARKLLELSGASRKVDEFQRATRGEDELSRAYRQIAELVRERNSLMADVDWFAERVAEDQGEAMRRPAVMSCPELDRVLELSGHSVPPAPGRSLGEQAERFLALLQGEMRPVTYREVQNRIGRICQFPVLGEGLDVSGIDERKVEEVYLHLKHLDLATVTRASYWSSFRRLVRYLWSARLIERPRNLDTLVFKARPKAVPTYPLEQVRACLDSLAPRLRLFALLGLNCGMLAADIGELRKDQVNLTAGRLVRKRVKTADHADVPTVDYKLWPETIALLTAHWSDDPTLALTTKNGTPLWTARQDGARVRRKDIVGRFFRHAKAAIPHKRFRSISATLLESHATYGRYVGHFLGHSPKSLKDRHYAAPSRDLFDQAMGWLREQVFPPDEATPTA